MKKVSRKIFILLTLLLMISFNRQTQANSFDNTLVLKKEFSNCQSPCLAEFCDDDDSGDSIQKSALEFTLVKSIADTFPLQTPDRKINLQQPSHLNSKLPCYLFVRNLRI